MTYSNPGPGVVEFTFDEYIEHATHIGTVLHAIEHHATLKLLHEWLHLPELRWGPAADLLDHRFYVMPESDVAFARNFTDGRTDFTFPLHDLASHPPVQGDWNAFLERLAGDGVYAQAITQFFRGKNSYVNTGTLSLPGVDPLQNPECGPNTLRRYLWVRSPVVDTQGSWDDFMRALAKRRRDKLKSAMRSWSDDSGYHMQCETLSDAEVFEWALPNLRKRRHYLDWGHALRQFLLGHVASKTGTGAMYTLRDHTGALVACWFYLYHRGVALYQGFVKDEGRNTNSLGSAALGRMVAHYCERPEIHTLDPTCITQPLLPALGIDTYKRSVVTTPAYRAICVMEFGEDVSEATPPYTDGRTGAVVCDPGIMWTPNKFEDL